MSNRNWLTGYYLPTDEARNSTGYLRHCHNNGSDLNSAEWHNASNVHPATPEAHAICHSLDPICAMWAKVNANLPQTVKAQLIAQAKAQHDTAKTLRNDII